MLGERSNIYTSAPASAVTLKRRKSGQATLGPSRGRLTGAGLGFPSTGLDNAKLCRNIVKPFRTSLGAFIRRVGEVALLVDERNYNPELGVSKLSLEQTR